MRALSSTSYPAFMAGGQADRMWSWRRSQVLGLVLVVLAVATAVMTVGLLRAGAVPA